MQRLAVLSFFFYCSDNLNYGCNDDENRSERVKFVKNHKIIVFTYTQVIEGDRILSDHLTWVKLNIMMISKLVR
jgi:hypothetical protein